MVDVMKPGEGAIDTPIPWPYAAALVLHGESPAQLRWAARTALELVRDLAEQQSKVVLTELQEPGVLGELLRVSGGPGIVDVLFRGTSFSTAARRPDEESFHFLPIGNTPPPVRVIYRHPQWAKIAQRLPKTGAHLLVCVRAHDWLESGPVTGFESCIVLNATDSDIRLPPGARRLVEFVAPPEIRGGEASASPREAGAGQPDVERQGEPEERPVTAPGQPSAPEPAADVPPFEDTSDAEPEPVREEPPTEVWAETETVQMAPEGRPSPPSRPPGGAQRSRPPEPPARPFRPRRRPSRRPLVIGLTVAAVLAIVLWTRFGSGRDPAASAGLQAAAGSTEARSEQAPEASVATPDVRSPITAEREPDTRAPDETAGPPPRRAEVPLGFSVAIASFSSLEDALKSQRRWNRDDLSLYVAPTIVRGVVYYRVYAGMLPDRAAAESLMSRLVDAEIKASANTWDVRPTELAFSFGVYPDQRAARKTIETLTARGIPAYVVPAAGPGDEIDYHVYAGGYETPEDAHHLRQRIESAGLDAELVERVGLQTP